MSNERTQYEAMVEKMAVDGYEPTPLEEVSALGMVLPFQENRPVEERLGRIRGMVRHLRSRPLREGRRGKAELELLKFLGELQELGEAIDAREAEAEDEDVDGLIALAIDRQRFEDLLYAATEDFFARMNELDEPFTV